MSNQQKKYLGLGFLLALLLGAAVLGVFCLPQTTSYYRSAWDKTTNETPWQDYLKINNGVFTASIKIPSHVVSNNIIYLQVRKTTSIPILLALIKSEQRVWTLSELRNLSTNHPELKGIWPEPEAHNLGVEWVSP